MSPSKKQARKKRLSVRFRATLRRRLLSGLLVVVPLGVTLYVLHFLYAFTAGRLTPIIRDLSGPLPDYAVPLASVAVLVVAVYLIGLVANVVVGRKVIALFEAILARIPLVKTIYGASKQIVQTLSFQNGDENFKAVVFVDFPRPGMKALGFVTGTIDIEGEGEHYKVFVPTTPNPTSGYFEIVPKDRASEADISVEEAVKFVMSGGLLAPESLMVSPDTPPGGGSETV
jgi:uncharacterized membrane protein